MSTANTTQAQLEASYKATLAQLSHILAFQARVHAAGGAAYSGAQPPRQMAEQLQAEMARFDKLLDGVEERVLRALAVLDRDARAAAGLPPLAAPSPPPASAPAVALVPAAAAPSAVDESPLPFTLPVSTAAPSPRPAPAPTSQPAEKPAPMELDLTMSPSPPPHGEAPLPFQLPGVPPAPIAAAATAPPPAAVAPSMGTEDLDALLSSIGMAPFSATPASTTAALPSAAAPAPANGMLPDLSMDALNALLNGASSSSSAPPAAPGIDVSLASFGGLGGGGGPGEANVDFSSLMGPSTGAGGADAAPGGGLADLDFSALGAGEFDMSQLGTGVGGATQGEANLEELLKSLG
ncbi:hypothetical protein JCM10213_009183 [Rhodosporidiobolus nylandii]